jgi:hypothetical protein
VSGGKSPIALFHALRDLPLSWEKVTICLADERCVPVGHPHSNAALVSAHLLQGLAADARLVRMIDSHEISFLLNPNGAPDSKLWYSATNPDLTIRERIRRKLEVHEAAIRHAWPVWRQTAILEELRKFIIHNRLDQDDDFAFHSIQTDSRTSAKRVVPIVVQSY